MDNNTDKKLNVTEVKNIFTLNDLEKAFNDGQLSVTNVDEHGFNAEETFNDWYSRVKKYLNNK
jgi:hypothetical protein